MRFVELSDDDVLVASKMHTIFRHPEMPDAIIKVVRRDKINGDGRFSRENGLRHRLKPKRREGYLLTLRRELIEQLVARRYAFGAQPRPAPIALFFGVVDTSYGFGAVFEKITDPSGALAPTLAALVRNGQFDRHHQAAFDEFFERLKQMHICVGDFHEKNIVFTGTPGAGRFVAVDGYGHKAVVPLAVWSKWFNARQLDRHRRKMLAFIERERPASAAAAVPKQIGP